MGSEAVLPFALYGEWLHGRMGVAIFVHGDFVDCFINHGLVPAFVQEGKSVVILLAEELRSLASCYEALFAAGNTSFATGASTCRAARAE